MQNTFPQPAPVAPRQVLLECLFLILILGAVALWRENTPVMSIAVPALLAARFLLIRRRGDWIFLLIGVAAGGGNDLLSMIKGVYRYTPQALLPLPIPEWMLLFWGYVFVAFRQLFSLAPFRGPAPASNPWKPDLRLAADIAVVIVFRVIIYRYVHHEPIPTIGYAAVLAARLLALPPKKHEWLLMGAVLILGPAFEAGLIARGLYIYENPVFLGMPAWLLIYWAFILPIFMKGIFDRIETFLEMRKSTRLPTQ